MSKPKRAGWWTVCHGLAHHILHTRKLRRKFLLYICAGVLGMILIGSTPWGTDQLDTPGRFLLYWGICCLGTIFLLLLALFDLLSVVTEEKQSMQRELEQQNQEFAEKLRRIREEKDEGE